MPSRSGNLRAGIYSRESKDKTKSIEDQEYESAEAARENSWSIVATYADGSSASRFGRKVRRHWERLLADLDHKALDVVVVWEPSRADRDLETWVTFVSRCRTRGVLVHLTGDGDTLDPRNPSHWHRLITGGVDAAMESEKTSKRSRRGAARAAAQGRPHGPAPFGYTRVIVGEQQTPYGPRPVKEQRRNDDAPVVVEIFERLARHEPISALVRNLNDRGVRPPKGQVWNRYSVREMATNPAYCGTRRHRSQREGQDPLVQDYEGTWEPLVDPALFHQVQDVLGQPDRRTTKPGGLKWMLSYLATSSCGGQIHTAPGTTAGRAPRYVCLGCGCVSVAVEAADEVVSRLVCARLSRPDVRSMFAPDDSAARAARAEAAELKTRLEHYYDQAAAGELTAGGLAAMEKRLLPQIADAQRRARAGVASAAMADLLDAAEFGAAKARPVWDGFPVAARRECLTLLADIVIGKADRRLSRWATENERLKVAFSQLGGSRWMGDGHTWTEGLHVPQSG